MRSVVDRNVVVRRMTLTYKYTENQFPQEYPCGTQVRSTKSEQIIGGIVKKIMCWVPNNERGSKATTKP